MNLERQFISTIAANPHLAGSVTVKPSDFSDLRNARIYETVSNLVLEEKTPELFLITELLEFEHGGEWLGDVSDVFSYQDIPINLDLVQDRIKAESRLRQLKRAGTQFLADVDKPDSVSNLMSTIDKIDSDSTTGIVTGREALERVVAHYDAVKSGEIKPGIPTGLFDLDELTGGLVPGESIVVAARTSVGKTAFMCNLAANCGVPCGIISGEQSSEAIFRRIAAKAGRLSMQKLKTGKLASSDEMRLRELARQEFIEKLLIVDQSRPSIDLIEQQARAMHYRHGIQALFVDYLQIIHNSKYPNDRRLQVADISARLKAVARDLNIPVVMLAQLNREAVERAPRISDLKESGAIEEDADQIILLHHEKDRPKDQITASIQKNREGQTGDAHFLWEKETMTFRNLFDEYH